MSDAQQADTPLSQKVQDLDRQISAKVESLVREAHAQIGERVRAATDDVVRWIEENAPEVPKSLVADTDLSGWLAPPPSEPVALAEAPATGYRPLLDAISRIDAETGQADILGGLLEESLRFSSRSAFFLIRQGQVRGWAGKGFGEPDQRIGQIEEKADQDPWSQVIDLGSSMICSDEQLAGMAIRFNTSPGDRAVLVPFAIRGQIAGLLYSDEIQGGNSISVSGLQLLVHAAASALETASVSPGLSPCLKLEGEPIEPGVVAAETQAPEVEEVAAAEVAVAEPIDSLEPAGDIEVQDVEVQDVVAPPVEEVVAPQDDSPTDHGSEETGLSTEDLETTVVPAISDDVDAVSEIVEPEPEPAQPVSEPTVEIDAPALSLSSPEPVPEAPAVSLPSISEPEVPAVESQAPVAPEPPPVAAPPSFESVSPPSEEEIALEAEPEPELEDTNAWELESDEEDDEPTHVGRAVKLDPPEDVPSPPAFEISASESATTDSAAPAAPAAPGVDLGMPIGQETVRLPIVAPPSDSDDATSPVVEAPVAPTPPPAPAGFGEPPAPAASAPPATFAEPPPSPTSFADPPPSPASFADPPPAPASFADPPPPAPVAPTSFAEPAPVAPAPPAAGFTPPAEESNQVRPPSGGSEVRPPSDLEGPGLAFATPADSAEKPDSASEALHEEARRLARLLVSEIKLYNEEIIEEGRRTGNIYERLKDDIDRSRQMYEERIDPRLADQEDYFHQELIQRLAGGDVSLLGM